MSFCRITGRSRGLPRPNYFPLLPPISPADAKRFCRITGKSYGLPTHHYIPVLLDAHTRDKSKCRITTKAAHLEPHHYTAGLIVGEKKKHVVLKDYRYVFPILEGEDEQQRILRELFNTKQTPIDEDDKFVYTVEERRCSLVFPAKLEAAVRDGDVKDVMLSRDCDTVLLRLKQGKNVSVDFKNLKDFENIYDGLGPREEVLKERERLEARKRKRKKQIALNYTKKIFEKKEKAAAEKELWYTKFKLRSIKEKIKEEMESWKYMYNIKGLKLNIKSVERFVAGKTVHIPSGDIFVPRQTLQTAESLTFIPGLILNTCNDFLFVPGQIVTIDDVKTPVFITGQTLRTERGECFVQGQTFYKSDESKFIEDQTVLTKEGPKFVAGEVTTNGTFVAGQTVAIPNGICFIAGQTVVNHCDEMVFVLGQNVQIDGKYEFIPGQCVESLNSQINFVPGQTLLTTNGLQFPGQYTVTKSVKKHFVPGIVKEVEGTSTFIPGMILDTPKGQKFVEDQVLKTSDGVIFCPEQILVTKKGISFVAASKFDEVIFRDAKPIGIPVDLQAANVSALQQCEIFGNMIQTKKNVEFFPDDVKNLPEDKRIVPGQLVSGDKDGPRFVPDVMTENGFLSSQIVTTEKGKEFVPGQVIDTSSGPKFVPGQIVETCVGSKFVPGQTVETADGPRFVPSQIVDTKVGPTFIPGQVIYTEKNRSKFVPGQVMDTPDRPKFVPGYVMEIGEAGVIFMPGQIAQTENRLCFVAPDLIDTLEGEIEFSVQGFEVTPEELRLLCPQHLHYNPRFRHRSKTSIDAKMLRKLSKAGFSVGRKVASNLPAVDIDVDPKAVALEQVLAIVTIKLNLQDNTAVKMAQIVSTVAQLAKNIVVQQQQQPSKQQDLNSIDATILLINGIQSFIVENDKGSKTYDKNTVEFLQRATRAAITVAVLTILCDQQDNKTKSDNNLLDSVYSFIGEFFNVLLQQSNQDVNQFVDEILKIFLIPQNRNSLCQSVLLELLNVKNNKIDILKSIVNPGQFLKKEVILDKLSVILEKEHGTDLIGPVFRIVSKNDPELVTLVLKNVSRYIADVTTKKEAVEMVHKAIIEAVQEFSEIRVKELLNVERSDVHEMLLQAIGLVRALNMSVIASSLLAMISDEQSIRALANDCVTMDVLKRLAIMRKLAEERPPFINALEQLYSNPELTKADPKLQTLVRESAALIIVPQETPLLFSTDVQTMLLHADNSLAIEEFLLRRNYKPSSIFMILKKGFQAVVPREASKSVLTGQVVYTVQNKDGIHNFEPLHVFSALKLNCPTAHRFSMYCCLVAKKVDFHELMSTTFTVTTLIANNLDAVGSANGSFNKQKSNYIVTLSRFKQLAVFCSDNRKNTPSLKRPNCARRDESYERVKYEKNADRIMIMFINIYRSFIDTGVSYFK